MATTSVFHPFRYNVSYFEGHPGGRNGGRGGWMAEVWAQGQSQVLFRSAAFGTRVLAAMAAQVWIERQKRLLS